jgi:hypothetical protein
MRWKPLLKQVAKLENKEGKMNKRMQERADAYYMAKEQIVATMMEIANRIHNPPPAERKMPEQIIAPDITKLKQAHMKLREMGDILGIKTKALGI